MKLNEDNSAKLEEPEKHQTKNYIYIYKKKKQRQFS